MGIMKRKLMDNKEVNTNFSIFKKFSTKAICKHCLAKTALTSFA